MKKTIEALIERKQPPPPPTPPPPVQEWRVGEISGARGEVALVDEPDSPYAWFGTRGLSERGAGLGDNTDHPDQLIDPTEARAIAKVLTEWAAQQDERGDEWQR